MMNNEPSAERHVSANDARLLDEAVNRLQKLYGRLIIDRDALLNTLDRELQRGRRDMFSLIKAGQRALNG